MMRAKVCHITTGHSSFDDRIFYKEAASLARNGFEVSLLVPMDRDGALRDMGGNVIAHNEAFKEKVRVKGFVRSYTFLARLRKLSWLIKWGHLLIDRGRIPLSRPLAEALHLAIRENADVYHCHEIEALWVGILAKRRLLKKGKRTHLIWDIHEYLPARHAVGIRGLIERELTLNFMRRALREVDYVITANQITRGHILTLNRFAHVEVLYNCPPLWLFRDYQPNPIDHIVICHEGALPFNRGLKEIVETARVLRDRYGEKVEIRIIGDVRGNEAHFWAKKVREYGLQKQLTKTGWLPYEEVGEALSQCSVGIIFMEYTENNMLAGPPNKLFNYMRYGLPIVSTDLPETSRIVRETQSGLIVKNRSVGSLVKALSILIEDEDKRSQMGENARKAIHDKYSWEQMERRLLRVYKEILYPRPYEEGNV